MSSQITQLVRSLLKKDSIEQCSIQELQQYADRHPYFGAAQLLLTKKLQAENAEKYNEQLQKTLLFFHNPLWVEQLLEDTGSATITHPVIEEVEKNEPAPPPPTESEEATEAIVVAMNPPMQPEIKETIQDSAVPLSVSPVSTQKEELLFEPFHTVDYFASQGIRFKEEDKPKDKLAQQLKSFTEWLKTMKRLPVTEIAAAVDTKSEQKVEQLAEKSLQENQVVTEAMAEVWEKQGFAEKAIEIYNKLSLLEPSKSAYFAAKIEELKKKN